MKISIGLRLFAAVLLAILAVAAAGIALMRHNVLASFDDYAAQVELDRLDELSASIAAQYESGGGWNFLPASAGARSTWITRELLRLQERRLVAPAPPAVRAVAAPQAPLPPAAPGGIAPPPPPPAPALPPLPPPPMAPDAPGAGPALHSRITLLDAAGNYLAGRPESVANSARRTIGIDGKPIGQLSVVRPLAPSDAMALAFLGQLKSSLITIVLASVALSALAAMLLAAHFRKPIRRLAGATGELAAGRFDTRLPLDRSDELGELAANFNQLAQKLEANEQMRRDWVADTSHELRTPVAVLRAQIEAMIDGVRPATTDNLAVLARQVTSLNRLVDELQALARLDVGRADYSMTPVDAFGLLAGEARSFVDRFDGAGLALEIGEAPAHALVRADADRLRQVFGNLLENSLRYTAHGGAVRISAAIDDARLLLSVDDTAPGVPDEALARLAERFYRVDASRSRQHGGTGLGLALSQRIIQAHGGTLSFSHSPLGGLRATVSLPLADA